LPELPRLPKIAKINLSGDPVGQRVIEGLVIATGELGELRYQGGQFRDRNPIH
jgi:hypothetical protein